MKEQIYKNMVSTVPTAISQSHNMTTNGYNNNMTTNGYTNNAPVSQVSCFGLHMDIQVERNYIAFSCLALLPWLLIVNIMTMYAMTQFPVLRKNSSFIIVLSSLVSNLTYGLATGLSHANNLLTKTEPTCAQRIVYHFTQTVGAVSIVLSATAVSILCFQQVNTLDINNKLTRFSSSQKKLYTNFHAFYAWFLSFCISTIQVATGHRVPVPEMSIILSLSISVMFNSRTLRLIILRQKAIRGSSIPSTKKTFNRVKRRITFTICVLIVAWVPFSIYKICRWQQLVHNETIEIIADAIRIIYPCLHPVLQISQTMELKRYFLRCFGRYNNDNLGKYGSKYDDFTSHVGKSITKSQPFVIGNKISNASGKYRLSTELNQNNGTNRQFTDATGTSSR